MIITRLTRILAVVIITLNGSSNNKNTSTDNNKIRACLDAQGQACPKACRRDPSLHAISRLLSAEAPGLWPLGEQYSTQSPFLPAQRTASPFSSTRYWAGSSGGTGQKAWGSGVKLARRISRPPRALARSLGVWRNCRFVGSFTSCCPPPPTSING